MPHPARRSRREAGRPAAPRCPRALARGRAGAVLGPADVQAAVLHGDGRSASGLHGASRGHLDEVRPGHEIVLRLEWLEVTLGLVQPVVRAHAQFRCVGDGAVRSASLGERLDALVVRAGVVPGQAHEDRIAVLLIDELHEICTKAPKLVLFCRRTREVRRPNEEKSACGSSLTLAVPPQHVALVPSIGLELEERPQLKLQLADVPRPAVHLPSHIYADVAIAHRGSGIETSGHPILDAARLERLLLADEVEAASQR